MTEPADFRVIIEQRDADGTWDGVFFSDLRPRDYGYLVLLLSGIGIAVLPGFVVSPRSIAMRHRQLVEGHDAAGKTRKQCQRAEEGEI